MAIDITVHKESNQEYLEEHTGHEVSLDNEDGYVDLYCRECTESLAQFRYKPRPHSRPQAKAPEPVDEALCERCNGVEREVNSTYCVNCLQQREMGL